MRLGPIDWVKQWSWRNDPKIYAWTRQNGPLTRREHEAFEERVESDRSIRFFGLWVENGEAVPPYTATFDGHCVGTCGLTSINERHGTAEFSLLIGPEYQGKGYGTVGLKCLLDYAFGALNLKTVWGETFVGNHALHIFKKVGMKEEGVLRSRYEKDNKRIDAISVSMTREEWYGGNDVRLSSGPVGGSTWRGTWGTTDAPVSPTPSVSTYRTYE